MVGEESTYLTHESGDVNKFLIILSSSLLVIKKILGNLAMDSHTGWSCNTPDHFMPLGNQDKLWVGQYAGVQTLLLPYLTISSN